MVSHSALQGTGGARIPLDNGVSANLHRGALAQSVDCVIAARYPHRGRSVAITAPQRHPNAPRLLHEVAAWYAQRTNHPALASAPAAPAAAVALRPPTRRTRRSRLRRPC